MREDRIMKTLDEFRKTAGGLKIIDRAEEREMYSHDIGDLPPIMTKTFFETLPDFVVQPKNVDEIGKVLAFANDQKIPVIPRGAASWGFGGVVPTKGGIIIDLSPFRKILAINAAKKTVTVEAGARWSDIDVMARKEGLCLMTYPSSKFSTVGGWISTGGYGINSFKYGHLSAPVSSSSCPPRTLISTISFPPRGCSASWLRRLSDCGISLRVHTPICCISPARRRPSRSLATS